MKSETYLKKSSDFLKVYRKKNTFGNKNLVLYIRKNNFIMTRAGFTINKKVGNAVTRNKIKRRLKALYRQNYEKTKKGYDLIFVVKPNVADITFKRLESAYKHILKKADLMI